LLSYGYPGNVRELASLVERAVTLAPDAVIRLEDLPERVLEDARHARQREEPAAEHPTATTDQDWKTLAELESAYIRSVLEWTQGNKQRAAKILGIGRKTLYRRLDEGSGKDDT
jgi:DNA-binding NtrC family response regulator